jgi:hypothetical protein
MHCRTTYNNQQSNFSNQQWAAGKNNAPENSMTTPTSWTCWNKTYCHTSRLCCIISTMDDTNLASKATERGNNIRKNKDFYDLNSSHFTSSQDGDFERAQQTKRARLTATQQKVDSLCTLNDYCSARTADTHTHSLSHTLTNSFSHRPQAAGHHLTST